MKKLLATLLIFVSIFTLAACNDVPDAGTINSTSESTTETTANPTIVQTPPITYEVKYIGANGEATLPYEEMMFITDIQIYSNGNYSQLDGDGYLAFYSVQNYLPHCVDKIPTVTLDENSKIEITAREGVSFEEITKVDVYGKDGDAYKLLAEDMTFPEIAEKGTNEWNAQTLYFYFDVGFTDTDASYEKNVRNGYFVKTTF